jgi:maltose/moltooligosaccharide transporter
VRASRTLLGISIFWIPLSLLSDGFSSLVVPVRVSELVEPTQAATVLGVVTFAGLVAGMLIQPVAGAVSDRLYPRWGRRGPLLVAAGLIVVVLVVLAAARSVGAVLVTFTLLMLAVNIAQAAQQGFIPDRVDRGQRGRAAGLKTLFDVGGAFIGFVILGALVAGGDVVPALVAAAVVVILGALVTIVLVDEGDRSRQPRPLSSLVGAARRDVATSPPFVRVVAARFLFLLGTYAIGRFFLLFVADRLGLDPATAGDEAGGFLAALTLITAVGAVPAGWIADRVGRVETMLGGAALSGAGALLLIVADTPLAILAFGAVMSIGSAGFAVASWAMTSDLAPQPDAGRLFGIANVGTAGAAALAGLFGPVADATRNLVPGLGYGGVFIAAVISFALSMVVVRPLAAPGHEHSREIPARVEGSDA